jgi:uncharacterized protein
MSFRRQHRVIFLTGLAFCLCLALTIVSGIVLAEMGLHPGRVRAQLIGQARIFPAWLPVAEQVVEIRAADGAALRATYADSTLEPNGDTVILLHGVTDSRVGMRGFARLFLAHGYSVLLPDSRSQGASGGNVATFGVLERDDIHRWVDWVSARSPGHCVYGLGESMGAAILLQAISDEPRFCAAVAESSFATFREITDIRIGQYTHTGPWLGKTLMRPVVDLAFLYAEKRYGVDLRTANPIDGIAKACTPVLLVHGLRDSNIPWESSVALHQAAPHQSVLWLVPNAGHCGASVVDKEEFDEKVLRWFGEHRTSCRGTSCGRSRHPLFERL